jgi:hypothetical protein
MANRSRKYATSWLLGIGAAIAASTWAVVHYLRSVVPEQPIQTAAPSEAASSPIILAETGVRPGASVKTADGVFTVRVDRVTGRTVKLTVSAEVGDVYRFNKAEVGRRLVVPAHDATYYVDLVRIRGDTVYLTMSRSE